MSQHHITQPEPTQMLKQGCLDLTRKASMVKSALLMYNPVRLSDDNALNHQLASS